MQASFLLVAILMGAAVPVQFAVDSELRGPVGGTMMAAAISFLVGARPRGGGASGPRGCTGHRHRRSVVGPVGVLGTFYVSFLLILTCGIGPTNTATFIIAG